MVMVKVIGFFGFLAAMLFIYERLYKLLRKLSYPMGQRHLQIRYLLALVLLSLVVFNDWICVGIVDLLHRIITSPALVSALQFTRPGAPYKVLYLVLLALGLNLTLLIAVVVLCLLVRLIGGTKQQYFLPEEDYYGAKKFLYPIHKLVSCFYTSSDMERSVLNAKGHVIGKWAGAMKWVFAVIGVAQIVIATVTVIWGSPERNETMESVSVAWYWMPMFGFLLADQISAFLTDTPDFEVERVKVRKRSTDPAGKLNRQESGYRKLFGDTGALLCSKEFQEDKREDSDITIGPGKQQYADCANPELLRILCEQLQACGEPCRSEHYQRALAALLDGKHINVCDQVEGEFFSCLVAYLSLVLSQGKTAVILCKRTEDAQRLKVACQESMRRLNSISMVWSVCTAREANKDTPMNLLICSFDELLSLRLLEIRREFASDLSCVVVAHGEQMFAQDSVRIHRLFNELQSCSTAVQYVLLSQSDNDSLRTAMERFMDGAELLPFNTGFFQEETSVLVWKEESCYKFQNRIGLGDDLALYMGTALPLALAAAKWDVPKTYIIPAEDRPDHTYWQCMCSNMIDVENYLCNHADVHRVIRMNAVEALKPQPLKQLICYDTRYHLIDAVRSWSKYAGSRDTILHIISPHYLLREYFADKFLKNDLKDQPVEPLISHGCVMDRSNMAALMVDLHDKGMTEAALLRRSREYGWSYGTPEEVLEACLSAALPEKAKPDIFEYFSFEQRLRLHEQDGSLVPETFVTLADADAYESIICRVRRARVQNSSEQRRELPILAGDITNYYLRDQQLVLDGLSYKIDSIRGGTIYVTQQNDRFAYEYFPVSQFVFEDYQTIDGCVDSDHVNVNIAIARATRQIFGYWRSNSGCRITGDGVFDYESFSDQPVVGRKTVNILALKLSGEKKGAVDRKLLFSLAYLLNGMFRTYFPDTYQNLFAMVGAETADETMDQITRGFDKQNPSAIVRSLIPVVKADQNRMLDSQSIYIVEYSTMEYGMVRLLYKNYNRILRAVQDYLEWYLTPAATAEGQQKITGTELHFGGDRVPDLFALQELLDLLKTITCEKTRRGAKASVAVDVELDLPYTCAFCGKQAVIMYPMDDGRMMCNDCYDHQVTDRKEIGYLIDRIRRFMEKQYGITLSDNLQVRFKNVDELRRKTGAGADQRLLGAYHRKGNQLWLEDGGPRVSLCAALIHELTHCWQSENLPLATVKRKLSGEKWQQLQQLLESHACFVEVQTLRLMNERRYADRLDRLLMKRTDATAEGYRRLKASFESGTVGENANALTVIKGLVTQMTEGRQP